MPHALNLTEQDLIDLDDRLDEFGQGIYETRQGTFQILGLRVQDRPFELGPISHRSVNDVDDEEPRPLDGLCAYGIGNQACCAREAIEQASEWGMPHAAIIAGNEWERDLVNDPDEIIVSDPVVISIIQ